MELVRATRTITVNSNTEEWRKVQYMWWLTPNGIIKMTRLGRRFRNQGGPWEEYFEDWKPEGGPMTPEEMASSIADAISWGFEAKVNQGDGS